MKIIDIKAMRGPNFWSVTRMHLVVMKLDLEELEQKPTHQIPGFYDRIIAMFPSMYGHRCSPGVPGGFFERVKEGTWMGHVIEHIALEIQTLAGMDCGFGRTRETATPGVYHVVFSYMEEKAGIFAARSAVAIADALVSGQEYDLSTDIQKLREIREEERLGPSTGSIVEEARSRGIPWIRLNRRSLVQLGYGMNQRRIQATVASTTSNIAVEIACDKEDTKNLLEAASVPVPKGRIIYDEDELESITHKLGYPLVIKPVNGNHGRGATIGIQNLEQAKEALRAAQRISRAVIIEQFITGKDHRLLVINFRFVAAALRTPAAITGNGKSTIQQLVEEVNLDPRRGYGHEKVLTTIKMDEMTMGILQEKGLTIDSVLPFGETLFLKATANLSTGGTSTDVTDIVHPDNIFMAERIARIVGLDICGIDVMTNDISQPLEQTRGAVLEVNAAPGFRMHLEPADGLARNVASPVVDMLYPPGVPFRIPIIAVTGTNGKTTTTRLTAHLMKSFGHKVGFTTTDGVYIQNRLLMRGDCTGPVSAEFVLKDPTVDLAVLECARGGILRAGLGFHRCDIAIVTNIAADHLGLQEIHTLEEMSRVKSVVPRSVMKSGYSILNADDDLVFAMARDLECQVVFFSMDEHNPRIKEHCMKGGIAGVVENGFFTILKGNWKIRVEKVVNVPLTFGGRAAFNIQNILPAMLAAYIRDVKTEDIRVALGTFIPGAVQTPGRMNLFNFKNYEVLIDYAHNTAGFQAIQRFLEKVEAEWKVGVIAGVGDRRDEDIISLGKLASQMFDEVIIRQDRNLRGRSDIEIIDLMKMGIMEVDPLKIVHVIPKEREAIDFAIKNARKGSFITICSDVVPDALQQIQEYKEVEDHFELTAADIPNR